MPLAVVTGSGGLIGSACVRHLVEAGFDVVGLENDMRARFFGPEASTRWMSDRLLGGGRASNCSMLEAIALCQEIAGRELDWELADRARIGDHRWISDMGTFEADFPAWSLARDVEAILREIHDCNVERWGASQTA